MRSIFLISALVAAAAAAPKAIPQNLDLSAFDAGKQAIDMGPPVEALDDPIDYSDADAEQAGATAVLGKRASACSSLPDGAAPATTPDTVPDFLANPMYSVSTFSSRCQV
jgi:hypothetical protein